jgi:hypothetical protein
MCSVSEIPYQNCWCWEGGGTIIITQNGIEVTVDKSFYTIAFECFLCMQILYLRNKHYLALKKNTFPDSFN